MQVLLQGLHVAQLLSAWVGGESMPEMKAQLGVTSRSGLYGVTLSLQTLACFLGGLQGLGCRETGSTPSTASCGTFSRWSL